MSKRVGSLIGIVVTRHFSFDPLHHAATGAAFSRRLDNTLAARERGTDCRFSRCVDPRPTDRPAALSALVSRSGKSGVYPFLNDRALELGEDTEHLEERPSGADEILQRSAKPVYRPRCNDIDLAVMAFRTKIRSFRYGMARPLSSKETCPSRRAIPEKVSV